MTSQLELQLDHEPCLNIWARQMADDDVASGYWENWDLAYESAWDFIDEELEQQKEVLHLPPVRLPTLKPLAAAPGVMAARSERPREWC